MSSSVFYEVEKLLDFISKAIDFDADKISAALRSRYPRRPLREGNEVLATMITQPPAIFNDLCFSGPAVELNIKGKAPILVGVTKHKEFDRDAGVLVERARVMTRTIARYNTAEDSIPKPAELPKQSFGLHSLADRGPAKRDVYEDIKDLEKRMERSKRRDGKPPAKIVA